MNYRTYEQRIKRLLDMIERGRLLSQDQAARQFSCSSRTIRRMICHLKEDGHNIRYSTAIRKFYIKK